MKRARSKRRPAGRQPNEIAEKILAEHEYFRNDRFLMQIDMGALAHRKPMRAIELFGTKVKDQVDRGLKLAA